MSNTFYSLINVVSASDLFRAASAGQLVVGLAPESDILNSSGLVNSSSHNPLDDPIVEDHRPSILWPPRRSSHKYPAVHSLFKVNEKTKGKQL